MPGYIRLVSKQTNMILLTLFDRNRSASTVFTNEQGRGYLQDKDSIICIRQRGRTHSQNYSVI